MSSKKNRKKRASAGTGNHGKANRSASFRLPDVNELKNPPPISVGAYFLSIAELVLVSGVWLYTAFRFFPAAASWVTYVLIAAVYFVGVMSMYLVRALLEAKRRYGKADMKHAFYYSQMVKGDQKWNLYIGMSFFAVFMVLRWLIPSPNIDPTGIDIASAFYLGYIWTTKYKGEDSVPFQYMETVFLFLTVITNYLVYFVG